MKYDYILGLSKKLSRLVLGTHTMTRSDLFGCYVLLDAAIEAGISVLDTAHVYGSGESERVLGQWMLERSNRDKVIIISKGAHHNQDRRRVFPYDIESDLYDSLARLQTDYIDIYMLHRDNPEYPVEPIVKVLNRLVTERRIRSFGGSNWSHERISMANDYATRNGYVPFSVSSPHFSLAEQYDDPWGEGCISISGRNGVAAREWYSNEKMPVFAYSSLARGLFSGKIDRENYQHLEKNENNTALIKGYCYEENFQRLDRVKVLAQEKGCSIPQIALAFVLHSPLNVYPIIGAQDRSEIESACKTIDIVLTKQELDWIDLKTDNLT